MPTRPTFIAGNWKMHKTVSEARLLASELLKGLAAIPPGAQVAIFPPSIALTAVVEAVRGGSRSIIVGSQNIHPAVQGAYTGEISAAMVLSTGATHTLVGHSERRHVFHEQDAESGKKVAAALEQGLLPVLCVGEKIEERESGRTEEVVSRQLKSGLAGLRGPEDLRKVIIAYEPVWAIGTGKTATPELAQEVHAFVRRRLGTIYKEKGGTADDAEAGLILYGGSVQPGNAAELLAKPDIDGLLVGGASLTAASFLAICGAGS